MTQYDGDGDVGPTLPTCKHRYDAPTEGRYFNESLSQKTSKSNNKQDNPSKLHQ